MSAESERLYKEFLENYGLQEGNYNHAIEMMDHPFEKIDKLKVIRFGDVTIPVSPAVKNAAMFNIQMNLAPITAEKEITRHIGSYKGCILDDDDANLFCYTAEDIVLRNLLWPFHLLTEQADLTEKDFYPLADMMEGVVCDVLDALCDFNKAVIDSNADIDAQTEREIDRMKRDTDYRAANAPVEISGTIRRNGKYLEVSATARSTVTDGMINAEYQAHNLLANQSANRNKAEVQRGLMNELERKLLAVIKPYTKNWYERLRTLGSVIGSNVLKGSIRSARPEFRPDKKENVIELIKNAPEDTDYAVMAYLIRYYEHDLDDLLGDKTANIMINNFIKNNEINEDGFYYSFYAYFYNLEHPIQHDPFFQRFRKICKTSLRTMCENAKKDYPEHCYPDNCDNMIEPIFKMTDVIPGISEAQKERIIRDARSVFYDVIGETALRDKYEKDDDTPRFIY